MTYLVQNSFITSSIRILTCRTTMKELQGICSHTVLAIVWLLIKKYYLSKWYFTCLKTITDWFFLLFKIVFYHAEIMPFSSAAVMPLERHVSFLLSERKRWNHSLVGSYLRRRSRAFLTSFSVLIPCWSGRIYTVYKIKKTGNTAFMLGLSTSFSNIALEIRAATKHLLSLLYLLTGLLIQQNSLVVLDGFVLPSWKTAFFLPSTLSPFLHLSFCPFSVLKDVIPVSSELTFSSHLLTMWKYLPHWQDTSSLLLISTRSLSSAAQQICCAVLT